MSAGPNPEQLHLTLKFLGNVPAGSIAAVKNALAEACAGARPFSLRAKGIGFFPNERSPRVVWAGIEDDENVLAGLQMRVQQSLAPFADKPGAEKFHGTCNLGPVSEISPAQDRKTPAARVGARRPSFWRMAGGGGRLVPQRIVTERGAAHAGCGFSVQCELEGMKLF